MENATINVPTCSGEETIDLKRGSSIVFIGANGAGKTRLGVYMDRHLSPKNGVHRIAAHRSLAFNPNITPSNLESATKKLLFGHDQGNPDYKENYRWQGNPAVTLLSDYDHLLAALYAENNSISVSYRQKMCIGSYTDKTPPIAKIDRLKSIWETILPHRELVVLDAKIKAKIAGAGGANYEASDMSDGERVIFYLIGQTLLAQSNIILIIDEPELHINRSIISRLWDEIESARPDCVFLYITHDVEFAASRHAATKYALRSYSQDGGERWDIERILDDSNLPDDVVATIIGSRRPVLFIEGDGGSLDSSIYRRVYNKFTVVPVGSCENVIHTVGTFFARKELHHVGGAGLIDADGRTQDEIDNLEKLGVYVLPVSEVENLLLLPSVFLEIAKALKFDLSEAQMRFEALKLAVLTQAHADLDAISLRYTVRRLDAYSKKIGLSSKNICALDAEFRKATADIDPTKIFADIKAMLQAAITTEDYNTILQYYDNKGLITEAGKQLGYQKKNLEEFLGRSLISDENTSLHKAFAAALPDIVARS